MRSAMRKPFVALLIVLTGCAVEPLTSETESAVTVGGIGTTCSTASVIGLSKQIADEIGCEAPDSLVPFAASSKVQITSNAVLPYLAKNAKTDLLAAATSGTLQINSAFRTIAQQYLLYHWYLEGACGITAAATVGTSNHESGRAVDLANYSSRITAMANHGWAHDVPGDPVHFDHLSSPDIRGKDTLAFQKLWNRNHPDDKIAEDGDYGPATEARLKKSPAQGFPMGPSCQDPGTTTDAATVVSVMGPDTVAPATQAHYQIAIKNTGTADWPATTQLVTADGMPSLLHDASWESDTVATTLTTAVAVGDTATIDLDVTTPMVTADTPIQQLFSLADGSDDFGQIPVALTVVMAGAGDSGDPSESGDDGSHGGGCSAGGDAGGLAVIALATGLLLARRRRRLHPARGARGVQHQARRRHRPRRGPPGRRRRLDRVRRRRRASRGRRSRPGDHRDARRRSRERVLGRRGQDAQDQPRREVDRRVHRRRVQARGSGWTKAQVVTDIANATSWLFMPIWVGQQSSSICGAHTLTAAQGTTDGNATVARMQAMDWQPNLDIPVALDVESGTYSGDPTAANAYVKAWTAAVHAGGYKAYAYGSPAGIIHFHDNGTGLDGAWVASWFYSGFASVSPDDLTQIGTRYDKHNRAWQYAGSFAVSGAGDVDGDTSDILLAPAPGGSNL